MRQQHERLMLQDINWRLLPISPRKWQGGLGHEVTGSWGAETTWWKRARGRGCGCDDEWKWDALRTRTCHVVNCGPVSCCVTLHRCNYATVLGPEPVPLPLASFPLQHVNKLIHNRIPGDVAHLAFPWRLRVEKTHKWYVLLSLGEGPPSSKHEFDMLSYKKVSGPDRLS